MHIHTVHSTMCIIDGGEWQEGSEGHSLPEEVM